MQNEGGAFSNACEPHAAQSDEVSRLTAATQFFRLGGRERQAVSNKLDIMGNLSSTSLHIPASLNRTVVNKKGISDINVLHLHHPMHPTSCTLASRNYERLPLRYTHLLASARQSSIWPSPLSPFTFRIVKCRPRNPTNMPYILFVFPAGSK